ncbi:uncharacterized protein LOC128211322 [Mya arenaria]|uniref:uncharacterized protein LOC128211322 n=1 Tax=Mya arenaria TaxID=6604 RepID=UPI0022E5B6F5|nr:uncharacterized protein LOC128211322 [Mya arenaria]
MESSINKGSDCVLHSQQHEASDCVHDYQCSVCKAKGLNAEASYCCTECRKLYCNNCITFHTQILKEHQVLTTQDKAKWVEFDDIFCCKIHTKQSLAYFCEEHDVVCCQKCVSIDHGCCRKIVNLSSLASGIRTKDEFTDGILEVNRTQLKLRSTQEEKKTTQKALRKTSDEFVAKIRTLRKDIDNVLDKMEADTLQQVSTAEKHVCELLRCDIEELNDYDERLEILLNKISEKYGDSDTATCLAFRQCIDEMKQAQISLEEDALTPSYSMALTLNSDIHTRLSAEKAFADVKTTATRVRQIHIKCPDDKNTCNITGICELETGGIIIADGGNSSLKLLNTYKEIVCTYRLQPYLKDICKVGQSEIAVAQNNENLYKTLHEICFFDCTDTSIIPTKAFNVDHSCSSLHYASEQLYMTTGNALYVYNPTGKMQKKLFEDETGRHTVDRLTVTADGCKIYVTNYKQNKVVCLDKDGRILKTIEEEYLKGPEGVCVDKQGRLYICGHDSNNVIKHDHREEFGVEVLGATLLQPRTVCVSVTEKLYVGLSRCDNLLVILFE